MEEKVENFTDSGIVTANSSAHSSINAEKLVDPLTGKRIKLIWQNGFSSFKENFNSSSYNREEQNTWKLHHTTGNVTGIQCASDGKRRLLELANFNGEARKNGISENMHDLYKTWNNPVFGVSKEKQLETQLDISVHNKQRKSLLSIAAFTFSKESLANVDVIGQVDSKFIACTLSTDNERQNRTRLLLLVDQHAAHERIRLEALQDEFLQGLKRNEKGLSVDCKDLTSPLNIVVTVPFDCSLKKLKSAFERIGILYIVKSENVLDEKNYVELSVLAMPSLFVDMSEKYGNKSILEERAIRDLFHFHIRQYQDTPLASTVIPPAINNVLCSYACHGAIRFGDSLTIVECNAIIKSLAKCRLPFQCAHGRPSIAPLINLSIES